MILHVQRIILAFTILFLLTFIGVRHVIAEDDIRKKVPHISARQALALFHAGKIILLDVHARKKNNQRSPIFGAYYIHPNKIGKVTLKIPRNMIIGVFCD